MGTTSRERPARQHEAADMLGEMAGEADQLLGQLEAGREQRVFGIEPGLADIFIGQPRIAQAPDGGGECGDSVLGEAERLPHLAHRRAPAIGDDGRGNPGAVAAVAGIDILDHLLAPLVLEIDVDVGRLLALGRDEALEQEIDLGRIDIGDGEAIADGRVGGRAAPLAEDAEPARIVHDVVHGEEIRRVVELLDQSELLFQRVADLLRDAVREAPCRALPGQVDKMRLRRLTLRHRLIGIFVAKLVEREGAGLRDLDGPLERILVAFEQARHFVRRLQVPLGIGFEAEARLVNGAFLADAGEHVLEGRRCGAW